MTTDKTPYIIWRDPVGLEPDGTISMNTGEPMSAETEQYRERLQNLGWDAWEKTEGHKGHVDEAVLAAVEAGYAQALRDLYNDAGNTVALDMDRVTIWEHIDAFAAKHGIEIDEGRESES